MADPSKKTSGLLNDLSNGSVDDYLALCVLYQGAKRGEVRRKVTTEFASKKHLKECLKLLKDHNERFRARNRLANLLHRRYVDVIFRLERKYNNISYEKWHDHGVHDQLVDSEIAELAVHHDKITKARKHLDECESAAAKLLEVAPASCIAVQRIRMSLDAAGNGGGEDEPMPLYPAKNTAELVGGLLETPPSPRSARIAPTDDDILDALPPPELSLDDLCNAPGAFSGFEALWEESGAAKDLPGVC